MAIRPIASPLTGEKDAAHADGFATLLALFWGADESWTVQGGRIGVRMYRSKARTWELFLPKEKSDEYQRGAAFAKLTVT